MPTGIYDEATLFWRHEALHRATLRDYVTLHRLYADERDSLEAGFVSRALERACEDASERVAFSAKCFAEADEAEAGWLERVRAAEVARRPSPFYTAVWSKLNRQAKIEV
jgi:hypothetical protein